MTILNILKNKYVLIFLGIVWFCFIFWGIFWVSDIKLSQLTVYNMPTQVECTNGSIYYFNNVSELIKNKYVCDPVPTKNFINLSIH